MNKKVISWDNLPVRYPVLPTVVVWLLMDRFHASGWIQGVVWTLVGIIWLVVIISAWTSDSVDILNK